MLIIFYRNKEGKIVHYHGNSGKNTLKELNEMAERYNRDGKGVGRTAYVEEVEDDSLVAHLFQKAEERKKLNKDNLRYAIESIEAALSAVQGLGD